MSDAHPAVPRYVPDEPVSVILPVFDRVRFLADAVDSVLIQDHPLELVIVDDGSTDGTSEVADAFAAADTRVRVIHQANAGAGAARNVAMRAARHRLVANQDSDDLMLPDRLARQVRHLVTNPGSVAVIGMARKEIVPGTTPTSRQLGPVGSVDLGAPNTIMMDREIALAVGGYDEDLVIAEDLELLAHLRLAGYHFDRIDEMLSIRRFHDTNISAAEEDAELTLLHLMRRHLHRARESS